MAIPPGHYFRKVPVVFGEMLSEKSGSPTILPGRRFRTSPSPRSRRARSPCRSAARWGCPFVNRLGGRDCAASKQDDGRGSQLGALMSSHRSVDLRVRLAPSRKHETPRAAEPSADRRRSRRWQHGGRMASVQSVTRHSAGTEPCEDQDAQKSSRRMKLHEHRKDGGQCDVLRIRPRVTPVCECSRLKLPSSGTAISEKYAHCVETPSRPEPGEKSSRS